MKSKVMIEVITPEKLFYKGEVTMISVPTLEGSEGFMANHSWACKLLGEGKMIIRDNENDILKKAKISGGFIDVKDEFVVFTDYAEWIDD